ncbi:hypothetical protein OTSUT76_0761 [Orientia tsutsugamushi str. UT76]|uniref:Uncharacterized protein n=1 Tax=Orientia tsutsugamushi TaxID=784 RepID=A0A2U3R8D2_ORITS|nr:hypothetical protein [Orientia tsutsugamushi]KJV93134.1 hypothetical protein OTSUT76_0761 [Orientia tsutsugamushi str. UT76]SPR09479.1 Uncharacterised protein [Orientia tsutsugamushi]
MITLTDTLQSTASFLEWTAGTVLSEIKDYAEGVKDDTLEFYHGFSKETKEGCEKIKNVIYGDEFHGFEAVKEVLKEVLKMLLEQIKCVQKFLLARKGEAALIAIAIPVVGKIIAPVILGSTLLIYALDKVIKKQSPEKSAVTNIKQDIKKFSPDSDKMGKYPKLSDLAQKYNEMDVTAHDGASLSSDILPSLAENCAKFTKESLMKLNGLEEEIICLNNLSLNSTEDFTVAKNTLENILAKLTTEVSMLSEHVSGLGNTRNLVESSMKGEMEAKHIPQKLTSALALDNAQAAAESTSNSRSNRTAANINISSKNSKSRFHDFQ